ncbi:MAG: hypothetical protein WKF59_18060 [Chitinophagaceae bacterium]
MHIEGIALGRLILSAARLAFSYSWVENIGNPNPKYTIFLTNSFSFKGFDFSVLLDRREGGDIYSRNLADLRRNGAVIETAEFPRYDKAGVLQNLINFKG